MMADETTVEPMYPGPLFPIIFSDGIMSASHGTEVVKFYLNRYDPDAKARGAAKEALVAQIVMPISAFVFAAAFMNQYVNTLVKNGAISKENADKIMGMKALAGDI